MTTLLHISASPRGERSESLALADTFLTAYRDAHPAAEIETWDLWDGTLPEFGPAAAHAKMAVFAGADPMGEEAARSTDRMARVQPRWAQHRRRLSTTKARADLRTPARVRSAWCVRWL